MERNLEKNPKTKFSYKRKTGVLIITDSFKNLRDYLFNISTTTLNSFNGDFLFAIVDSKGEWPVEESVNSKHDFEGFFRTLWLEFNILNSFLVISTCDGPEQIGYFDPFVYVGNETEKQTLDRMRWGRFYWLDATQQLQKSEKSNIKKRQIQDFNGYPIQVNQFARYPTALNRNMTPTVLLDSYIYKLINATNGGE